MQENKIDFRKTAREINTNISREILEIENSAITGRIFNLPEYAKAGSVFVYINLPHEVSTREIIKKGIEEGKKIYIPKMVKTGDSLEMMLCRLEKDTVWEKGSFCIPQPKTDIFLTDEEISKIDIALVPGVAFDRNLNRMGQGGGFYDRFFKKAIFSGNKIGMCFSWQIYDKIPVDDNDIKMDILI